MLEMFLLFKKHLSFNTYCLIYLMLMHLFDTFLLKSCVSLFNFINIHILSFGIEVGLLGADDMMFGGVLGAETRERSHRPF